MTSLEKAFATLVSPAIAFLAIAQMKRDLRRDATYHFVNFNSSL